MRVKLAPLALAITTASVSQLAAAEQVTKLDKVVVTATRSEASVSSISGTVQVIDAAQIQEQSQPGQKLADILEKLVPGMGPSTQTVTDRTQSLRGRKVLVLIDGISQQDNRQISRQMNSIRPENIERIEVVSGASAIYGGGATGGIVNIITKSAKEDGIHFASEAGIKVSDGKVSTHNLHQSISGRQGKLDFLVSGTYENRGGIFDARGNRVNPDPSQVSRNDTKTKDILAKVGYDIDAGQRLELTAQIFDDKMDSEYAPDMSSVPTGKIADSPAPVKGLQLKKQPLSKRKSIHAVYKNSDVLGNGLMLQTYYRNREARFFPYPNVVGKNIFVNQSSSTADVYGLKLNLERNLLDNLKLSYGIDYDIDKGKQRGQLHDKAKFLASGGKVITPVGSKYEYGPDVTTKTLGLYAQSSFKVNSDWTLNAGWRHERANVDISDYNPLAETWLLTGPGAALRTKLKGGVRKYDGNMFNAGIVYHLTSEHDLFANFSQGFEVPDVSRLLRNAVSKNSKLPDNPVINKTDVSAANLDAIKTNSYELGWRGRFESAKARVAVFYNQSDKTINFNADHNVDLLDQKKKVYGIEASADYFLSDNLFFGGSYSFTEGRSYYKQIKQWLDLQAADVSPQKVTAHVTYEQDKYNVRLQAVNFADYDKGRKLDSKNQIKKFNIEGYTTVDLLVSFQLPVGTMKAGITNLLNKDYETVYSQWARTTYSGLSAHKAEGRAYTLSYRVEY